MKPANGLGPDSTVLEGANGIDDLDARHLQELGLGEWIALPLEMSDGAVVGIVAALSRRQGDYRAEHVVLLDSRRGCSPTSGSACIRAPRCGSSSSGSAPPPTPMPTPVFTVARVSSICSSASGSSPGAGRSRRWPSVSTSTLATSPLGSPIAKLALKDAAEALAGAVRSTDQIGRVGEMDLGVAMIGCPDDVGVQALADRFLTPCGGSPTASGANQRLPRLGLSRRDRVGR